MNQKYLDFPVTDIRSGGRFSGLMVEGVVALLDSNRKTIRRIISGLGTERVPSLSRS